MATLLKDLIDIPAQVHRGDFVLNLAEGVGDASHTLRRYVVTPQLAESFEGALTFIKSAIEGRSSKAAYLHGSFGSGKSHFMAVLHLLLQSNREARSVDALQGVLARNGWLVGKRFLQVPFHMIGASSMESAVLGGYVEHVGRLHPDAAIPAVYRAEALFENAQRLRQSMGEARFFDGLNSGPSASDELEWGDVGAGWNAERFEQALAAPPRSTLRGELVSDLVATHLSAFRSVARGDDEALVDFDEGLSIISRHAHGLGYHGVVLFLDELILWLASNAGNLDFLNRESQKLAKLVESQHADRPVPIVSFAARQRDLRDLVGDNLAGAEMVRLGDSLQWFEGRFHTITLEDRNLPAIVEKRLLAPKDAAAGRALDAAFERAAPRRSEVLDTLLTRDADRAMFRQVYPFSPALVQALVALSQALQRERTALRVMLQLLVDQREILAVGDLIPLGDLWDVIGQGAEPFSAEMARLFDDARKLWRMKLRPLIEREHGVDLEAVERAVHQGEADRVAQAAWNDARLLKTLLLAELVPQVEAVRDLTVRRLAALNHGTIRSPIPGQEAGLVLRRLQKWAGQVGEIRLMGTGDPRVKLKLTGVDVEGLLDRVANVDNSGARKLKVRERLFDALGLGDARTLDLLYEHTVVWRGTERRVELIYGNVREMDDSALRTTGDGWRVLIDFPFDDAGFGPGDDVDRARSFLASHPGGSNAILWLPRFFSARARDELGRLVRIDHLLTGENFERTAAHLGPAQRAEARAQLENQQSALRSRLDEALASAYGLGVAGPEILDPSHDHRQFLVSLRAGFTPRLPATGRLGAALTGVIRSALAFLFPAHPPLADEPAVRRSMLRRVYGLVMSAAADVDGRVLVEPSRRDEVRAIAHPLELGVLEEGRTHFVVGTRWRDRIERARLQADVDRPTVGDVRQWLDPEDHRSGLNREMGDLIALAYAAQTNRALRRHGGPHDGDIGGLPDDVVLESLALPDEATWGVACARAAELFGVHGASLINAHNLDRVATEVRAVVADAHAALAVPSLLAKRADELGCDPSDWDRMRVALEAETLVNRLARLEARPLVEQLAGIELDSPPPTLGHAIAHAQAMRDALSDDNTWSLLARLRGVDGPGEAVRTDLIAGLAATELAAGLRGVIDDAFHRALALAAPPKPTSSAETGTAVSLAPQPVGSSPPRPRAVVAASGRESGVDAPRWAVIRGEIEAALARPGARLSVEWRVESADTPSGVEPGSQR